MASVGAGKKADLSRFSNDDDRWAAVVRRDRSADKIFILPFERQACIAGRPAPRGRRGERTFISIRHSKRRNRRASGRINGASRTILGFPNDTPPRWRRLAV